MNRNTIVLDSKRKKSKGLKVRRHASSAKQGFALVITISLMILLVLIGVGMLTLSSITLRTATQESAMATARANARMALMLAIGDLQRNAGPDQYVTARAEILDASPSGTVVSGVSQPYWTGTWRTGAAGLDNSDTGVAAQRGTSFNNTDRASSAHWLVSDPNPGTPNARFHPTTGFSPVIVGAGSSRNAVKMATNQGPSTNPVGLKEVDVPLVKIMDPKYTNPTGGFGYWVADEGIKAKVNMVDPTIGKSATTSAGQDHFLAPQANNMQSVINSNGSSLLQTGKDIRSDATNLAKTVTYKTVGLLPTISTGAQILNNFMPDVTTYSSGVIADVKDGGLKKDLTSAFESVTPNANNVLPYTNLVNNFGNGAKCVYRNKSGLTYPTPVGVSTNGLTDGLSWMALYTYYNTYKNGGNNGMPLPADFTQSFGACTASGNKPSRTGTVASPPGTAVPYFLVKSEPVNGGTGKYGGLMPELIAQRMDISIQSYSGGIDPATGQPHYKLRLRYCPQFVLYNPYNCNLDASNFNGGGLGYDRRYHTGNNIGAYAITVTVGGKLITTKPVYLNQTTQWYGNCADMGNAAQDCATLAPGETRVFGLLQDMPMGDIQRNGYTVFAPSNAMSTLDLRSGPTLSADWAHWCDLPTWSELPPNPSGSDTVGYLFTDGPAWDGTSNGGDIVHIEITPNNSLSGTRGDTFITNGDCKWPNTDQGSAQLMFSPDGPYGKITQPQTWNDMPISSLSTPRMLSGFFIRSKGIKASDTTSKKNRTYFNGKSVLPLYHGNAPYFSAFETNKGTSWREFFKIDFGFPYDGTSEIELLPTSSSGFAETFFGVNSAGVGDGEGLRRVLRDVPMQPLVSLGQFMHLPSTMVYCMMQGGANNFGDRGAGSMFVGGGMLSSVVPSTANIVATYSNSARYLALDDSYLANDTLFDRFYFSTVPPVALDGNAPKEWADFNSTNSGSNLSSGWDSNTQPLPNSRIKPFGRNGSLPLMSDLRDFDKAAANLMLDGAFNVNSTSVNAWMAFLSSLSGNDLRIYDAAAKTATTITSAQLQTPFPRFWSGGTADVSKPWSVGRVLSPVELKQLAAQIVQQVKTRGPFLSMSDFLNRRIGNMSALTRAGCLQAAIDSTSINSSIKSLGAPVNIVTDASNSTTLSGLALTEDVDPNTQQITVSVPPVIPSNLVDGKGTILNSTVGMPGYLMQQDIVQALSPAMTVRSDTFLVRAYGESVNPKTGEVLAKAWAEAVVQRVPEFVDSITDPDPWVAVPTDPSGNTNPVTPGLTKLTSNVNITLGRRFKMVGFRWLSPDEL